MSLPIGKYMARAVQAELGFADTGTELVAVMFAIEDGEHKGARMIWRGYFTEKTARRAIESLKYCGWDGRSWETFDGLGSAVVQLDVQEDRDLKTGEVRGTRVAWVNPARVPMKNSMDPGQKQALAGRYRGLVAEVMADTSHRTAAPSGGTRTAGGSRPAAGQRQPAQHTSRAWSSGGGAGGARAPQDRNYPQPTNGQNPDAEDPSQFEQDDVPFVTRRGRR